MTLDWIVIASMQHRTLLVMDHQEQVLVTLSRSIPWPYACSAVHATLSPPERT